MNKKNKAINQNLNTQVNSIANFLKTNEDTVETKYLDREKLDFSLNSLEYIEKYLDSTGNGKVALDNEQHQRIILRCGAYLGEVIRNNNKKNFSWNSFEKVTKKHKDILSFGKSVLTVYVLEDEKNNVIIFPMSKIEKYINNGKKDSLIQYASVVLGTI